MKTNTHGYDPEKSVIPDIEKGFTCEGTINYRTEKADKERKIHISGNHFPEGVSEMNGFHLSISQWILTNKFTVDPLLNFINCNTLCFHR